MILTATAIEPLITRRGIRGILLLNFRNGTKRLFSTFSNDFDSYCDGTSVYTRESCFLTSEMAQNWVSLRRGSLQVRGKSLGDLTCGFKKRKPTKCNFNTVGLSTWNQDISPVIAGHGLTPIGEEKTTGKEDDRRVYILL